MPMQWIDGHLDLAYLALAGRDLTRPVENAEKGCISLPALRAANINTVFGTLYTEKGSPGRPYGYASSEDLDGAEQAGIRELEVYETLEQAGEILIIRSRADLELSTDAVKVVILMEGADPIRSPGHARMWYDRGLRLVGMTWGAGTRYAGGNSRHGPLTAMGRELVAAFDDLGIAHDISHMADESVEDLIRITTGSIVASHSNCRALLAENQRHLPDDFIREIGNRGGVVGLNLYTHFLTEHRRATVDDILPHVIHVSEVMGHRTGVALGSDADGGFAPPELPVGLDHPARFGALAEALAGKGWSHAEVEAFTHGNWLRFLRETLPE